MPLTLVPASRVGEEERGRRGAELERRRLRWRYQHLGGAPPHVAGQTPLSELRVSWVWQLVKTGVKLLRARVRLRGQLAVQRWRRPGANAIELYEALYRAKPTAAPPDDVLRRWRSDEEFAYQRMNGLCPWFLTRAAELPAALQVTDAALAGVLPEGVTLASLRDERRLFITNHAGLDGAARVNGAHLVAPICLFWIDGRGVLMPLAIQLGQDAREHPLFTPADPPGLWLAVKMWASCADLHVHDMFVHTTTFHFVLETMWLAANRQLADAHPVKAFLAPHFAVTVAIGAGVRATIGPGGPLAGIHTFGSEGGWAFLRREYRGWDVGELDIVAHFARRDVGGIPGFHFRDDCVALWGAVADYCSEIVSAFYASDDEVRADHEVQAWVHELRDPALGGLRGLPGADGLDTREQLADLLSRIVFTAGPKHSMIRNLGVQYDYFVPNMPAMFHLPPPTSRDDISEADIAAALPPPHQAIEQMALMESIDQPASAFNPLGVYHRDYLAGGGAAACAAVARWQARLRAIDADIVARNATLERPYEGLLPSACFNSVWN